MEYNLAALSGELEAAVERAAPYVVAVNGRGRGSSSGVVWRDGVVVTTEHAIRREDNIAITLADGRAVEATLAGRDPGSDVAALRLSEPVPALPKPSSAGVKPGRIVLSLGRSKNSGINASMGILSAASGEWKPWRGGRLSAYLRLDLTLFPASTGGPVITPEGECIGVASSALSRVAPLAIPTADIDRVVDDLLSKGRVARGYLGVGLQPIPVPEHLKRDLGLEQRSAAIVLSVEPNSPAERAGMVVGDVLLSLAGEPVRGVDDVQTALDRARIGQEIAAVYSRGGKRGETKIQVAERGA